MFNVIRIPTKFIRTLKRLSKNDRLEMFDYLIEIWAGNSVELPDNLVGDTLSLIYWEWMNMEAKNGKKPKESLIIDSSEWVGTVNPSESGARVEYNTIEENRVEESKEIVTTEVATLQTIIKDNIDIWFFEKGYNSDNLYIREQLRDFYLHWSEKKPNWKKERWEMEKTFDVNRRFHKWLSNASKWNPQKKESEFINIT